MEWETAFMAGFVILIILNCQVIFKLRARKHGVTILDKAEELIEEAPEGSVCSVSVTLAYKTGVSVELKGPPDGEPFVKETGIHFNGDAREIALSLREEKRHAETLGL
jgi:hypothetical protein